MIVVSHHSCGTLILYGMSNTGVSVMRCICETGFIRPKVGFLIDSASMCQKQVDMVPVRSRAKMTSLLCKGSTSCLFRGLREQETHAECQGNDVSSPQRARVKGQRGKDWVSLLRSGLVWPSCFLRCQSVINEALVMLFCKHLFVVPRTNRYVVLKYL